MERITAFLQKLLVDESSQNSQSIKISDWINMVTSETSDADSKRIAISLSIDLKNGHLKSADVIGILSTIAMTYAEPISCSETEEFLRANCKAVSDMLRCSDYYERHRYATVLTWGKLSRKGRKIPITTAEFDATYRMYVTNKSRNASDFKNWNNFSRNIVWILPLNDLLNRIEVYKEYGLQESEIAERILDYLGLHNNYTEPFPSKPGHYLYIAYPNEFSEVCFQPNTLSAPWNDIDGLYLSFKEKDGYGRTCATCGDYTEYENFAAKERIHSGNNYGTPEFKIEELGTPDKVIKKITSKIIPHGIQRFEQ